MASGLGLSRTKHGVIGPKSLIGVQSGFNISRMTFYPGNVGITFVYTDGIKSDPSSVILHPEAGTEISICRSKD